MAGRRYRALGGIFLALLVATSCARPKPPPEPESERPPDLILSSEHADRKVGEEGAKRVEAEMGLVDDPELVAYVESLGRRISVHAPHSSFEYQFRIVDQDIPNAFALPGGFIYVSRGLLALSGSEDELANVIGHEITHVSARHAAGRQVIAQRGNLLGLPGAVVGAVLGEKAGKRVANSIKYTNPAYIAAYSRDQERAADRMGQKITSLAGYDPAAMVTFLKSLSSSERLVLGRSRLPSFFDTHPTTPSRSAAAASYAQTLRWERRAGSSDDSSAYLERLDGLIVGENPAGGVFRDELFLHADLDFSIHFPKGWELKNTQQFVGAQAPDGRSSFVLEFDSEGDDPEVAANDYVLGDGLRLGFHAIEGKPIKLGHLAAFRLEGKAAAAKGQSLHAEITFVAHQGKVFRMIGSTPSTAFLKYQGSFRAAARSFRPLTASDRLRISGNRLRLVRAIEGESLFELSERTGNVWPIQKTAVMNNVFSEVELSEGQLIKIAKPEPYVGARRLPTVSPAALVDSAVPQNKDPAT